MSNQVGLMLTFLFLGFFLAFSGDLFAYQQTAAKAMSQTTQLAVYLQSYGYNASEISKTELVQYFDKYNISPSKNYAEGYQIYYVTTKKTYHSFTKLNTFFKDEIVCQVCICRKGD